MRPLAGGPLRRARSGRRLAGAKLKYTDMNSKYALPKDGGLIVDSAPSDIIRRYEKIPASVFEHESEGVGYVADLIVRAIKKHNEYSLSNEIFEDVQPFVLGLTTGRTPLGLYHELVRRYRDGTDVAGGMENVVLHHYVTGADPVSKLGGLVGTVTTIPGSADLGHTRDDLRQVI